jgi:cytochrome c553
MKTVVSLLLTACAAAPLTLAAQQPPAAVGDPAAAEARISTCRGCHSIPGYQASFPRVYRVPKIGGQSAKYIENALHAYKRGERSHPTMQAIARGLTDQDILNIAAYYEQRGADR